MTSPLDLPTVNDRLRCVSLAGLEGSGFPPDLVQAVEDCKSENPAFAAAAVRLLQNKASEIQSLAYRHQHAEVQERARELLIHLDPAVYRNHFADMPFSPEVVFRVIANVKVVGDGAVVYRGTVAVTRPPTNGESMWFNGIHYRIVRSEQFGEYPCGVDIDLAAG